VSQPVAIVGMACRFPGAADLAGFWKLIRDGRAAFSEIPRERWNHELFYSPNARETDKAYARKVGFVDDVWSFPALHHGLAPLRAKVMDPQHRLLVEAVRAALADAGHERRELPRASTGVFVGASVAEHKDLVTARLRAQQMLDGQFGRVGRVSDEARKAITEAITPVRAFSIAGNLLNMMAATVAQVFDLGGPAFTIDAACSSALVAAYEAVTYLRAGLVDAAVAGGVYLNLTPDNLVGFSRIGAISKSDACRPFDAAADGFVLGEGVGVVVLKRLADAERDGDRIYAVIRGAGINNDGRGEGPMTPRKSGQVEVLRRAYQDAAVAPDTVGFVEAHGTATGVGDVVEVGALREYYEAHARGPIDVTLSSVKANIGHTMSAAGVAGLIKAALVLQQRTIPRQAAFDTPHASVPLDGAWKVATEERRFESRGGAPRRAAVSSFGFGGTNCHMVLEEAPAKPAEKAALPELFVVSAPTAELLAGHLAALRERVAGATLGEATVAEVAATLAGRRREAVAVAFVARTREELLARLAEARPAAAGERPKIAFLFPGQGAQAVGLCRALVERFPALRARLEALAASVRDLFERPLLDYLYAEDATAEALTPTEICQPVMAALGLALAGWLGELGVEADVMTGHSLGEIVAAGAAGRMAPEAALRFVAERGRLMRDLRLADAGAMAAVAADRDATRRVIDGIEGVVAANLNHPKQTVISGTTAGIEAALARCAAAGVPATRLPVSHAFHSPVLAAVEAPLRRLVEALPLETARVPLVSCIDPGTYPEDDPAVRALLVRHATSPVDFMGGARACAEAGARVFLQVGAGNALLSMVRGTVKPAALLSVAAAEGDDTSRLLATLAELAQLGVPVRVEALYEGRPTTWLPATPLPVEDYRCVVKEERPPLDEPKEIAVAGAKDELVALFREQMAVLATHAEIIRKQTEALGGTAPASLPAPAPDRVAAPAPAPVAAPAPAPVAAPAPAPAPASDTVESKILDLVAQVGAFPRGNLTADKRLIGDLGFDSLMVVELAGKADAAFPGLGALPKSLFVNDPTVKAVAEHVARTVGKKGSNGVPAAVPKVVRLAVELVERPLGERPADAVAPFAGPVAVIPGADQGLAERVVERLRAAGLAATVEREPAPEIAALVDLRGLDPAASLREPVERLLRLVRPRGTLAALAVAHRGLAGSALAGFAKALAREQPAARVKALEFDDGDGAIAERVVDELLATDATVEVSYRGGRRRVAGFRPAAPAGALQPGLRVAIVGGTRGIGAKLGDALRRNGARVTALGRSAGDVRCDVTDAASLRAALAEVGPVDVLVHAAGVLADAPVARKRDEDLARVFDTKASALALLDACPARTLMILSSWAGRFGNASQTDYAAASHLVSSAAAGLARPGTRVVAIDLPPWEDSAMARGIPGPVKAAMKASGVPFLDDATGLALLLEELASSGPSGEILVGPPDLAPERAAVVRFRLTATEPYLDDHRIGGKPVLPLAAAASLALEAAGARRLAALELTGGVSVEPAATIEVRATGDEVEIATLEPRRATAYRAVLSDRTAAVPELAAPAREAPTLSVADFYAGHTFHGPRMRGVVAVTSVGDTHVAGTVRAARPGELGAHRFAIDPLLLDSCFQLAGYWGATRGRAGLPLSIGELRLLAPAVPGAEHACLLLLEKTEGDLVTGHIDIRDPSGALVAQLRGVRAEMVAQKPDLDRALWDVAAFPEVKELRQRLDLAQAMGIENPYFRAHDGVCADTSSMNGREVVNFSSYNYLGLSGDPEVNRAVVEAVERYGTSVSASRVASGERPLHRELETAIAGFLGCEDAIAMVGGHATNVGVIGHLLGPGDLIVHDSLAHDSILGGARLSGARRRPFPHNDVDALDRLLTEIRPQFRRVLVAIEGTYSMDGDIPRLDAFVAVKRKHRALMLVDEAHSLGVLGATGRGVGELFGVERSDVELWMGTLSKTLASCGGYIAGSRALVEYLKYTNPSFVYSVGLSPANAAAALAALRALEARPELVTRLQARARTFLELCRARGINTGMSDGSAVVPCIVGNSYDCLRLATALGARGINVQPILYPAVEEHLARLRFFITAKHSDAQLRMTADALAEELGKLSPAYLAPPRANLATSAATA
jgi:8-amino-7-oxononanoate synthase